MSLGTDTVQWFLQGFIHQVRLPRRLSPTPQTCHAPPEGRPGGSPEPSWWAQGISKSQPFLLWLPSEGWVSPGVGKPAFCSTEVFPPSVGQALLPPD